MNKEQMTIEDEILMAEAEQVQEPSFILNEFKKEEKRLTKKVNKAEHMYHFNNGVLAEMAMRGDLKNVDKYKKIHYIRLKEWQEAQRELRNVENRIKDYS